MKVLNGVFFVIGVAVGYAIAYSKCTREYAASLDEEISRMKNRPPQNFCVINSYPEKESPEEAVSEDTSSDYPQIITDQGYHKDKKIYVISPDEFGMEWENPPVSLTYYADGILADDNDVAIDNPINVIGIDPVEHFGEYEDDAVYVRNEFHKCDYEILKDCRTYDEILAVKPYKKVD